MKIQIDTEAKTIKLEGQVNIAEFVEKIQKLFPDDSWKEYKLETNTIIHNWSHPIVIRDYPVWPAQIRPYIGTPWWQSPLTVSMQSKAPDLLNGRSQSVSILNNKVFNVEA